MSEEFDLSILSLCSAHFVAFDLFFLSTMTDIFMLMEAMIDSGVHMGFSRETATTLVHHTLLGALSKK